MTTSFGHNSHHPAILQKLKKLLHIVQNRQLIFVNNQLDAQFFFMYVYFYSLHVSGGHVTIIRRINCISTTSGICHSV